MEYAIIRVPAAALRRKPGHPREMVNQLLFGEAVKVLRTKNEQWVKVRSLHDDYEGWMTLSLLEETDEITALQKPVFVTAGLLTRISNESQAMHIPAGASLPAFADGKCQINKQAFQVDGLVYNRLEHQPSSM